MTGVDDALGHSRLEMAPEIPNSNASGITLGMWGNARSHHSWLAAYNKKMKRRLEGEVSPSQGRCRDGGLAFIYYNSFPGILICLLFFWHNLLAHPICNTATEGNHILVIQQTSVTQKGPVDSGQPSGTRQLVPLLTSPGGRH